MDTHQSLLESLETYSETPYWDSISINPLPDKFSEWSRCIYCEKVLNGLHYKSNGSYSGAPSFEGLKLNACLFCGWWFVIKEHYMGSICRTWEHQSAVRGVLLKCNNDPLCRAIPAIRKYINDNPRRISNLTPLQFEVLLKDLMSDYLDCEVRWTGRGADGGVDLFAVVGDELTIVQVKHRTHKRSESVQPVRELLGTMVLKGAARGIFVTTAEHFTKRARTEAASPSLIEKGIRLELIEGEKLLDIVRQFVPRQKSYPWSGLYGLP